MRAFLTAALLFWVFVAVAQAVPAQQPVEEKYDTNYWWWILSVLLAIGAGIGIYMLIKKDPRRDAVR